MPNTLTPSQQAALDGTGGLFIPVIEHDSDTPWSSFRTLEGDTLPFRLFAAWSSITPGLPTIQIDTEIPDEHNESVLIPDGSPALRVWLNDEAIYESEEAR